MAYILDLKNLQGHEIVERFEDYKRYLESLKSSLPPSAFSFATAEWHYNFEDHRSPHDSWVEWVSISEPAVGKRKEKRALEISVRLLGAFHDGYINLRYVGVHSYSLGRTANNLGEGHGDWLIDEVRLGKTGSVVHEVRFSKGAVWVIECDDIIHEWCPLESEPKRQ